MEGGDTTVKRVESDDESGRAMGQYKQGDGVFFLGLFDGAQTLHIDFEDKGCKRSVGMSYTIVARRGLDNENDPAVPEAFFFGAGNAWASDGIQFRYKKHAETGSLTTFTGSGSTCRSSRVATMVAATLNPTTTCLSRSPPRPSSWRPTSRCLKALAASKRLTLEARS